MENYNGDGVMADKGFPMEKEIESIGLKLNILPIASCSAQMKVSAVTETVKINKHRVNVERDIPRMKRFKILSAKLVSYSLALLTKYV